MVKGKAEAEAGTHLLGLLHLDGHQGGPIVQHTELDASDHLVGPGGGALHAPDAALLEGLLHAQDQGAQRELGLYRGVAALGIADHLHVAHPLQGGQAREAALGLLQLLHLGTRLRGPGRLIVVTRFQARRLFRVVALVVVVAGPGRGLLLTRFCARNSARFRPRWLGPGIGSGRGILRFAGLLFDGFDGQLGL